MHPLLETTGYGNESCRGLRCLSLGPREYHLNRERCALRLEALTNSWLRCGLQRVLDRLPSCQHGRPKLLLVRLISARWKNPARDVNAELAVAFPLSFVEELIGCRFLRKMPRDRRCTCERRPARSATSLVSVEESLRWARCAALPAPCIEHRAGSRSDLRVQEAFRPHRDESVRESRSVCRAPDRLRCPRSR